MKFTKKQMGIISTCLKEFKDNLDEDISYIEELNELIEKIDKQLKKWNGEKHVCK